MPKITDWAKHFSNKATEPDESVEDVTASKHTVKNAALVSKYITEVVIPIIKGFQKGFVEQTLGLGSSLQELTPAPHLYSTYVLSKYAVVRSIVLNWGSLIQVVVIVDTTRNIRAMRVLYSNDTTSDSNSTHRSTTTFKTFLRMELEKYIKGTHT